MTFVDPDAELVTSLGLTHLPAFVHLRQDTTLVAAAEGWDPARGSGWPRRSARRWPGACPTVAGPATRRRPPAGRSDLVEG